MRLRYSMLLALAAALAISAAQVPAQEAGKETGTDDVSAGEALFNKKCAHCHSLAEGKNGNGPSLFGIVDRPAAAVPGFKYSRALRRMAADESLKWSTEILTAFLHRPSLIVPGTRMAFPGVSDQQELGTLVDWIMANSEASSGDK